MVIKNENEKKKNQLTHDVHYDIDNFTKTKHNSSLNSVFIV